MSLRKRPDGTYVIRYYADGTKKGIQRQETLHGVTYAEAHRIYKHRLAGAAARRGTYDHRLTFRTLAEEYLNVHCAQLSAGARERARIAMQKNILPFFGDRLVSTLKSLDVEKYRQMRLAARAQASTVNREWQIVKAILNKGEAWGLIERNPIRRGSVPMLSVQNGRLVFFEREEWARFIAAFDHEAAWRAYVAQVRNLGPVKIGLGSPAVRRYGGGRRPDSAATDAYRENLRSVVPLLKALLLTGSRLGEITRLTWADVDLERGVVAIRQQKTGRAKTVPISGALRKLLLSLRRGLGAAPVFARKDGASFSVCEVQRAFRVARKLSGVRPELTPHSLRHTFASWLAIAGTPLRTIQELLGHRDVRMTIRYSHLSPAHLREAVEVIGSAENPIRLREGCAPDEKAAAESGAKSFEENWWPQRESNPRSGLERAVS